MEAHLAAYLEKAEIMLKQLPGFSDKVQQAAQTIVTSLKQGGKVLTCGNGGSAADAQHIAAELIGRYLKDRPAYAAIALTTDTSILTAVGNDYSYADIFARQVDGLGKKGDVLIAISTSGNSENVIRAVQKAKEKQVYVIGLLGRDGGKLKPLVDLALIVPAQDTPIIQIGHSILYHSMCHQVENELLG